MIISLTNIGKLHSANVKIDGITVIAGENNTGKSTVSKSLFSVFNSFFHYKKQILSEREDSVDRIFAQLLADAFNNDIRHFPDFESIAKEIVDFSATDGSNLIELKNKIMSFLQEIGKENDMEINGDEALIDKYIARIWDVLNVSEDEIFKSVLNRKINIEFGGQINNIYEKKSGEIRLQIKNENIIIKFDDNNVSSVQNKMDLHTEAVYLDDTDIFDDLLFFYIHSNPNNLDHNKCLIRYLIQEDRKGNVLDEIITNKKMDEIYAKISSICSGELTGIRYSEFGYMEPGAEKVLKIQNLSMGLKTFVILKTLLEKGIIEQDGLIILDEPEIHLHPEWQLLFAELIVLIQKEFSLHILLNTHSPYFLRALQVFAGQYEVADKCHYYLAEEDGKVANIGDVTGCEDKIYAKLAKPFQDLEDEEWRDD